MKIGAGMRKDAKRVLLVAAKTGYQVREFAAAAEQLNVEAVLATDRCHVLEDPWGDQAVPVNFARPAAAIRTLAARPRFQGILAVGDQPAVFAARTAEKLGLRFHPYKAALIARNKLLALRRFRAAGLLVPAFRSLAPGTLPEHTARTFAYPCVIKPLNMSASRGVIRVNSAEEFVRAYRRVAAIAGKNAPLLVEEYVPGKELALEGVMTRGHLQTLALFDKPDPLDGPFFEETIYVTPSRQPRPVQSEIRATVERAAKALGLSDGPVHAEMRVNEAGVWMLEAAARPIGGLCARVLNLRLKGETVGLEALLLRHALGEDIAEARLARGGHGVMMIPIPHSGVYQGVHGLEEARAVNGIKDVVVTAKQGHMLECLPEGTSYLGFIFARASTPDRADAALRKAHGHLRFSISNALPVIK